MLGLPERLRARGGKEEELYTRVSVDQDLKIIFRNIISGNWNIRGSGTREITYEN